MNRVRTALLSLAATTAFATAAPLAASAGQVTICAPSLPTVIWLPMPAPVPGGVIPFPFIL